MLNYVDLGYAKKNAHPGWLIQYRGNGWFSPWVRLCTGGVHTHSAMVTGFNEVSEVREFVGGRISTLDFQYERYATQMDFYSITRAFYDPVGVQLSIRYMRTMGMNSQYDWWNILTIALRRIPLFHLCFEDKPIDDPRDLNDLTRHCSDAIALAYSLGLVDPVPRWPNRLVTPHDLTKSMLFHYEFSL